MSNYNNLEFGRLWCVRFISIYILTCAFSIAQAQPKVGSWRSHLPMNFFNWIDEFDEKVFAANQYGVLVFDKNDESAQQLSKINALSQTRISAFACTDVHNICVVGYDNGNIDIIDENNSVTNQPAILSSSTIGDKSIKRILFNDDLALLVTGLGVLELELATGNILEHTRLKLEGENARLRSADIINGKIYFASPVGVFSQSLSTAFLNPDPKPIQFDRNPLKVTQFFEVDGEVYLLYQNDVVAHDTLFRLENDQFVALEALNDVEMRWIDVKNDELLVTNFKTVSKYSSSFELIETIDRFWDQPGLDARMAVFGNEPNEIVVADGIHGMVISSFEAPTNSTIVNISSPRNGLVSVVKAEDGVIYSMPGGDDFTFNAPNLSYLNNGEWTTQLLFTEEDNSIRNPIDIEVYEDKKYVAFDRSGFMVLDEQNNIIQHFNDSTSQIIDVKDGYYGIRGIEIDEDGNVWMLNNRSASTLSLWDKEGKWTSFTIEGISQNIVNHFIMLSNGMLAFGVTEKGVIIYDPGDTPSDKSDDRFVNISSSPDKGNLTNNGITCFAEDLDGELWIGTEEGINVIYNPENAFDAGFEVQKIIVNQDGFNGYLFESDAINAIAVDGANRKWVAPNRAGLFLISSEGQEQLLKFTEEDSPLLSNSVSDIAIEPETGELFIASENGLQSYRSDATDPEENLDEIKVFPNPVKPGYSGLISFNQLTSDSYVRVTDAAGNLVYETQSKGGSATWDGKDNTGQRVASGVYLVFCATAEGSGGAIAKLLFLN